ncbi:RING finger protein 44-like isoform X1 [Anneissia japonica]|uniref:RING finger protein 44-like isoform X1 n=2 Tax=Anneissia japonica TaxID=1529436 RepID=UPI0014254C3E|nr:RING finger protein 44-like isoform X1 [Anneissia japonica]
MQRHKRYLLFCRVSHRLDSESPTRKRRRMSQGLIDLAASPSPPLVRPWQTPNQSQPWLPSSSLSNYNNPRLGSIIDRCNTQARISDRRSPQARRQSQRQRERQSRNLHNNNSNNNVSSGLAPSSERTAFQPPIPNQRPYPSSTSQTMVQPHIIIDFNDLARNRQVPIPVSTTTVPVSIPVSMPTYAVPICTGHSIPGCNLHHGPYTTIPHCNTPHPPPFPVCGVGHFPLCSVTQLPGCNSHHMPVTQPGVPSFFTHEMLMAHPHLHHHAPPVQYIPAPPHQHARQPEVELISERPAPFHHVHSLQHTHSLNQSTPMHMLPESMIRNPAADVLHMHPRLSRPNVHPRRQIRGMWRSPPVPPQPTYTSGLLLHYIVPNASVAPTAYGVNLDNENAEVENYEALLNLAERLGEAKPKGLTKSAIDQLPSYRYNPDTHKSHNDQTCCVVCMSEFETRQLLRVLPCSHEFHAKCVDKWLKTNRTCPICRADASDLGNTTE